MSRRLLVIFAILVWLCHTSFQVEAQSTTNLALKRPVTVSSYEDVNYYPAAAAVDGDQGTRWESQWNNDPEWIYVDLGAVYPIEHVQLTWEAAYATTYQLQVSNDAVNWTTIRSVTGNTSLSNSLSDLHSKGRYVRIYGTARGTQYGYSLYEFEVYSVSILSSGKQGTASSSLGNNTADKAFDRTTTTRWESTQGHDPEWIYVDLGSVATIREIVLTWETAAGKNFQLQVSNDASTWTTIQEVNNNQSLSNDYPNLQVNARYVRMYGTARTTQYGYSLYEFTVYGSSSTPVVLPVSLTYFRGAAEAGGIRLQWATATEKDNQGFELQRSTNGTAFTRLAFQNGAGNSTTTHTYQHLDTSAPAGLVYYRLKQIDQDGTATYTPVVAVQSRQAAAATYAVYPNPTVEDARLTWTTEVPTSVVAQLLDGRGQTVYTHTTTETYGQNLLLLDLRPYPTGIYFLTMRNASGLLYQTKVVKAQ